MSGSNVEDRRVLVAMSGGVDSSVAAALLVEQGFDVVGATMKTFCYSETDGPSRTCCGLQGINDARRVSEVLGIPHYVYDVEEEFTRDVVDDFVNEYARGRTPNPCVRCNSNTKFRDLLRRGRMLGCDAVASGHYVRMEHREDGSAALLRGVDDRKDQSYFLWGLPPEMLGRIHFPLGALTKPQVREQARTLELVTADKPESQEICFVPSGDYRSFLQTELRPRHPALEPGPLVRTDGSVVGEHEGYARFTVGQRKGLGGGFDEPMYVLEVRPEDRAVVVGTRDELASAVVEIGELNWLAPAPGPGDRVEVQIRYGAEPAPATVDACGERLVARFEEPQRAVTPGQSGVVYRGERLLGGGRIARALD